MDIWDSMTLFLWWASVVLCQPGDFSYIMLLHPSSVRSRLPWLQLSSHRVCEIEARQAFTSLLLKPLIEKVDTFLLSYQGPSSSRWAKCRSDSHRLHEASEVKVDTRVSWPGEIKHSPI